MQLRIKQEGVKRGKSYIQKCRDVNLDLRVLDGTNGAGEEARPKNYRREEIESISVPTFL